MLSGSVRDGPSIYPVGERMELINLLLNSLPEPYLLVSRELVCMGANRTFAELVESEPKQLVGKRVDSFWPAARDICEFSGEHTVEFHLAHGKVVTARVACRVADVVIIRVLSSVIAGDSAQLHHKQRLESLGLLAGGIAHDFNNVLTGILGHVAYLKHVLPANESARESLDAIEEGALRASGLSQQILRFSRIDAGEQSTHVDVPELMGRVAVLLKSAIPSQVRLEVRSTTDVFRVLASEALVTQILVNLIINARDAISGSGMIEVVFEPKIPRDELIGLFGPEPAASHYGALVVRDDGAGMSDEVKARLFEPYFTTKSSSGTGLGLATVHSIVEQLGGAIRVASELGKGSEFTIVLPLVGESLVDAQEVAEDSVGIPRGNGERVLVIDDEYAVRNVIGLSLTHLGYAVETAASGLEGIEKFESADPPFQLVILDLLMPGLSGEEVFYRLYEQRPGVPVLIVSGFSSEHVVQRLVEEGGCDFIQKPFSIELLADKVKRCLHA